MNKGIMDACDLSIEVCYDFFQNLKLTETEQLHCTRCSKRNQRTFRISKKRWPYISYTEQIKCNIYLEENHKESDWLLKLVLI